MYLRPPYLKGKKFCPNPIAKFGIPKYADSLRNGKVIGTAAHEEFWSEQLYYIIHGYDTGGMHITGDLYYFYNFRVLPTVMGPIRPDICDLHIELSYLIEEAERIRWNILVPKARRKGLSEFTQTVIDRGWRFFPNFHAGIAAGHDKYIQDFMDKWRYSDANTVPEFRIKKDLGENKSEIKAGYRERNDYGEFVDCGTQNMIYMRTMHGNPGLFKGLFLNKVIGEEGGEFKNIKQFNRAVDQCVMHGDIQFGMKIYYGTGGNMSKESKEFKEIAANAQNLRFLKLVVPGPRFYFPYYGGATEVQGIKEIIPNLQGKFQPYQLIGIEDIEAATKAILVRREELMKSGDIEEYHKFCQEVPLDEKEIFRNTNSNNFDAVILSDKLISIEVNGRKYIKYKPEWITDKNGMIKTPLKVKMVPAKQLDKEEDCVLILASGHPREFVTNLFAGGVDSYDKDQSKTSKSLGAMCVFARDNGIAGAPKKIPVAIIRCRPKYKEKFYDLCAMTSVYYDLRYATLIDVANGVIFEHYKNLGLKNFLAKRPVKFESDKSEQMHEFGINLTPFAKSRMVSLMQTNVREHGHEFEFPVLIEELQNYEEMEVDSDNDLADAYGIALIQDRSMDLPPKEDVTKSADNPFKMTEWVEDENGNMVPKGNRPRLLSNEQDMGSGYIGMG